ncbi:DUF2798 domain-containing protein [bacterium SCSIO 12741]|nr:DUF2798 domain-containing protein [bacterium SCSIO 12741]
MIKKVVFALLMGGITTGIISFALVAINLGFNTSFLSLWMKSWVLAYLFVIPAILLIAPTVQKWVDRWVESLGRNKGSSLKKNEINQKR